MSELISKGILADPHFKRVETGFDIEKEISPSEAKLIDRYGELPATLISKIANARVRNKVIVKDYLENKAEYGKTLIFALDVVHCRLLCEELKKHKIKCEAIFNGNADNELIISRFKSNELDVLVNVNIMTEGSDVPDIETIMLTRPTSSDGLLMQMIGRGMRGKAAHGTEKVTIVDFHDKWNVFQKWLNPEWIINAEVEMDDVKKQEYRKHLYQEYDWKMCLSAYRSLTLSECKYSSFIAIPSV